MYAWLLCMDACKFRLHKLSKLSSVINLPLLSSPVGLRRTCRTKSRCPFVNTLGIFDLILFMKPWHATERPDLLAFPYLIEIETIKGELLLVESYANALLVLRYVLLIESYLGTLNTDHSTFNR